MISTWGYNKKSTRKSGAFQEPINGLEPSTSAVTGRRSNQLSHWAVYNYRMYLQNCTST